MGCIYAEATVILCFWKDSISYCSHTENNRSHSFYSLNGCTACPDFAYPDWMQEWGEYVIAALTGKTKQLQCFLEWRVWSLLWYF